MEKRGVIHRALAEAEAPTGLYQAVLARIAQARQIHARRKALWLTAASFMSGFVFVPALVYAGEELYASGFYTYVSLAFSDSSLVFSVWREFAFTLIESVPSIALLLVLASGIALAWSVRRTIINARIAFSY